MAHFWKEFHFVSIPAWVSDSLWSVDFKMQSTSRLKLAWIRRCSSGNRQAPVKSWQPNVTRFQAQLTSSVAVFGELDNVTLGHRLLLKHIFFIIKRTFWTAYLLSDCNTLFLLLIAQSVTPFLKSTILCGKFELCWDFCLYEGNDIPAYR